MNFKLKKPCANCPFLEDPPFYLRPGRRDEIADSLERDGHFTCHKTVNYDSWGDDIEEDEDAAYVHTGGEQFCAGALITMIKGDHEWLSNAYLRIAQWLGGWDPDAMDLTANTFVSLEDFRNGPEVP